MAVEALYTYQTLSQSTYRLWETYVARENEAELLAIDVQVSD